MDKLRNNINLMDNAKTDNDHTNSSRKSGPRMPNWEERHNNNLNSDEVDDYMEEFMEQTIQTSPPGTNRTNNTETKTNQNILSDVERIHGTENLQSQSLYCTEQIDSESDYSPNTEQNNNGKRNRSSEIPNTPNDPTSPSLHNTLPKNDCDSTNKQKKSRRDNDTTTENTENNEMDNDETETNNPSTSTTNTTTNISTGNFYTFIIHGKFTNFKPTTARGKSPNFIYFDHGNHIHILYYGHAQNKHRTFERITKYLQCTAGQITGGNITLIPIYKTIEKFIAYLLRKGLNTWTKVGEGLETAKNLWDTFKILLSDQSIDVTDGAQNCIQYMNEKRTERKQEGEGNSYAQQHRIFGPMIKKYNIQDITELKLLLSEEELTQYFIRWGKSWENNVQALLEYIKSKNDNKILQKDYYELLETYCKDKPINKINEKWIEDLFKINNINFSQFMCEFIAVKNKDLPKRNTLVLLGIPNSGKSLLASMLTEPFNPTIINRQGENSVFYFQNLLHASLVLMEEPTIGPHNANTFKTLLGGEKYSTDVKNGVKQTIQRKPFVITSNEGELGESCTQIDKGALQIRSFIHKFSKQINNQLDITNGYRAPPSTIQKEDLYRLILQNKDTIQKYLIDLRTRIR